MEMIYKEMGGMQVPDWDAMAQQMENPVGHYGDLHLKHMMKNNPKQFESLFKTGKLLTHLREIDQRAEEEIEKIISALAQQDKTDEELKQTDPMKWTGLMNNYKHIAEEQVLQSIVLV